jgi:phospholipid/cholesterol/gamma-HCH transport system permease protein
VVPRIVAGFIMIPSLTVLANITGVLAGWWSVTAVLPVTNADFIYGAQIYYRPFDAYYSIIKSFFFAGAITSISCFMGFNTKQGAEGVGKSTTTAVVASSVFILLLDAVISRILLNQ